MAGKDPALSARMKSLRWRQTELSSQRQRAIEDGQYKIAMVQAFFRAVKDYLDKNGVTPETQQQAYQEGLKTLPKDDPSTPLINEGKTEQDLKDAVEKIIGKPFGAVDELDVARIEGDEKLLQDKMRIEYGKLSFIDSELDSVKRQIQTFQTLLTSQTDPNAQE